MAYLAKPRPGEKELALWAVDVVRRCGGVLEHPARSKVWEVKRLPPPGIVDQYGGFTLPILQKDWGHKADKATFLYIVGIRPADLPSMPMTLGPGSHCVTKAPRRKDGTRKRRGEPGYRPELSKAAREHTPPMLAAWLVEVASRCAVLKAAA